MSECLCLHREPRIESGWRSGSFTRDRSGRTRCSHQPMCSWIFNGWNEKKKKIGRENLLPLLIGQRTKKRFIAIRIDSSCFFYMALRQFPTSTGFHSLNGFGYEFGTRLPIIILARCKKKKKNAISQSVFTLIGRSVDTIVNEDSHESPCSPCRS